MTQVLSPISSITKLQRTYELQVQGANGDFFTIGNEQQPLLSLEFNITRNINAQAQSGIFRIKNLSYSARNSIYHDYFDLWRTRQLILKAGYQGNPLSTIFNGIAQEASSYRAGGSLDYITEIVGNDLSLVLGGLAFTDIPTIIGTPVTQLQVINQLIGVLQAEANLHGVPLARGIIGEQYTQTYGNSYSLSGYAWELLQQVTDKTCFIDSNKIYCLQNNETFVGPITLISAETGLLGTPRKFETYLVVQMIFEPGLAPGQQVFLDTTGFDGPNNLSSTFNGTYRVTAVQHAGSISSSEQGFCITTVTLQLTPDQRVLAFPDQPRL